MNTVTIPLPTSLHDELNALAARLDRPPAFLAAQAIGDFVARQAAELAEIEAGLADADGGDFAGDAEIAAVLEKYRVA